MNKIFFICNRYTANQDIIVGKFGRQINLAKGLKDLGYTVTLYCADYKKQQNFIENYQGIKLISSKLNHTNLFLYCIELYKRIRDENPNIIIGSSVPLWGFIGFFIALFLKKKYIYDIQDNYEHRINKISQYFEIVIHKVNLLLIHNITVVNENLLNQKQWNNKNGLYLPNVVNLEHFKPLNKERCRKEFGLARENFYIGYCGTISKDRGIHELQKAFIKLQEEYKNCKLIIAGGGDIERIISHENILYLGNLKHDKIPVLINAFDLYVVPYIESDFTKYCFPYKVIEAMACNQNILISKAGVLKKFHLDDKHFIDNPKDILRFKEKLKNLLRKKEHNNFRSIAEAYSIEAISQNFSNYIKNLLRKRIAIIADTIDNYNRGGTTNYALHLINHLAENKAIELFVVHKRKIKGLFKEEMNEIIIPAYNNILLDIFRKTIIMPFILIKNNIDLVHETYQMGPFLLPFLPFKKIVTVHDVFYKAQPSTQNIPSRIRHTLSMPIILKRVDKIITVSSYSKKDIIKYFHVESPKIEITQLGIDDRFVVITNKTKLSYIKQKYNLPEKFILTVATVEPRKNILSAIKSINNLKNKGINIKYIIVGNKVQTYFNSLKNYINLHKLNSNITFLNYVDLEDLPYLYNLSFIFLFPSFYEGFGLPVAEAMACGCSIITSKTASLPEITGNAAEFIDPNSIDSITTALYTLITNKGLREELSKKSINRSKSFSWKVCADKTLSVYNKLLMQDN